MSRQRNPLSIFRAYELHTSKTEQLIAGSRVLGSRMRHANEVEQAAELLTLGKGRLCIYKVANGSKGLLADSESVCRSLLGADAELIRDGAMVRC